MLELKNVSWELPDGHQIIKNISLTIPDGKLVVVTGPNGGGKTTLAKIIAGLETPTGGQILVDGKDITQLDVTERANFGISYAFQQPVRFKGLTVKELLELAANRQLDEAEACEFLSSVGLCAMEYVDRDVDASLSGGEIKRIEIATVLARGSKLSLFDEPEAGIDLWSFSNLINIFNDIKTRNTGTLMIISHQERIMDIADDIIVISEGEIRASGPREEILPNLPSGEFSCTWGEGVKNDKCC